MRISICIVCMNRLHHLKQTLLKNIEDNLDYPEIEFIVLDYSSQDGMSQWVKENLPEYLHSNVLKYYKYYDATVFSMAHSKNMAVKLGTGDIICLVDADNFTGKGYATHVSAVFKNKRNIFLTTINKRIVKNSRDTLGRVCFRKADFQIIGGYDEHMSTYGFDDFDLANRFELIGINRLIISQKRFLKAIEHTTLERLENMKPFKNFDSLYVHHVSPGLSKIIFLYKNNQYHLGTIVHHSSETSSNYLTPFKKPNKRIISLIEKDWIEGQWQFLDGVNKSIVPEKNLLLISNHSVINYKGNKYKKVTEASSIETALYVQSTAANYNYMVHNIKNNIANPNGLAFGSGDVKRLFEDIKA